MKILLVSASSFYRKRLNSLLLDLECEVLPICEDGNTGIQVFRSGSPEICIIDVLLPEKSGFELAKDILTDAPEAKTIIISDLAGKSTVEKAMRCGARDFLLKPFSDEEFVFTVQKFIEV